MRGAQAFVEGADRVELARVFRTADDAKRNAQRPDRLEQRVIAFLAGGDDDRVGFDGALLAVGGSHSEAARHNRIVRDVC